MLKKYVDVVHKLIEVYRNELRIIKYKDNNKNIEKVLDKYEHAYYCSCLKIEEYIEQELKDKDLNQ